MSNFEYQVLEADSAAGLRTLVEAAMQDQWKAQGGISITFFPITPFTVTYAQAMARDPKDVETN